MTTTTKATTKATRKSTTTITVATVPAGAGAPTSLPPVSVGRVRETVAAVGAREASGPVAAAA